MDSTIAHSLKKASVTFSGQSQKKVTFRLYINTIKEKIERKKEEIRSISD